MIVTFLKDTSQLLGTIPDFPEVREQGNKLYLNGRVIINDLSKAGYAIYPDQIIEILKDEENNDPPIFLNEINLIPMSADTLPISEHIGKLISVNPAQAKPAVVRRRFWGENYDVNCLVTQSVAELYQAGNIQIGDYVLVSFIEEIPNTEEREIAIVTDKIFKSW